MRPFARGVYVNYLGVGDEPGRVREAYSPEKYARLADSEATIRPAECLPPQPEHPPSPIPSALELEPGPSQSARVVLPALRLIPPLV